MFRNSNVSKETLRYTITPAFAKLPTHAVLF